MYCLKCKKEIAINSSFCVHCGAPTAPEYPTRTKPSAGFSRTESNAVKIRKRIFNIIFLSLTVISITLSISTLILAGIIMLQIYSKKPYAIINMDAFYTIGIISVVLCVLGALLLISANKRNSPFRVIGAFFLYVPPYLMGLNIVSNLWLRRCMLIAYPILFIVMIILSAINKKEMKAQR